MATPTEASIRMNVSRQQLDVPTDGDRVDCERPLRRKAQQVVRSARLWSRTGETLASERLHSDNCADHVPVYVRVAYRQRAENVIRNTLEPAVHTERETKAGAPDRLDHLWQLV